MINRKRVTVRGSHTLSFSSLSLPFLWKSRSQSPFVPSISNQHANEAVVQRQKMYRFLFSLLSAVDAGGAPKNIVVPIT